VWDGVFVGLTDAKGMLWGTFVGAAFFFGINFLPQLSILALRWCSCLASVASRPIIGEQSSVFNYQLSIVNYQLSNHFLWLAFNAYLLMRGITQEIIWRKVWKNKEK
jgi:Na+-driven multidrug efflux pump